MQIIFATDNEPASKVIQVATSCLYQHVGVVFGDYVIEARFVGVVKTPLAEFKARGNYKIFDHPLNDKAAGLNFALDQVGKKYDFIGLSSFPFRVKWQDDSKWYCSELVAAIAAAGSSPLIHDNLKGASPRDILVILNYIQLIGDNNG